MINNNVGLRDNLIELIQPIMPVYHLHAPDNASYPYAVFEVRRLTYNSGIYKCILEINLWDKGNTESRIDCKMDEIEHILNGNMSCNSDRTFIIHTGSRQHVEDEDKTIKRIREQFDLTVVERR